MRQRQRDELRGLERLGGRPLHFGRIRLHLRLQVPRACGAGRTSSEAGINSASATMPITSIAVRQS